MPEEKSQHRVQCDDPTFFAECAKAADKLWADYFDSIPDGQYYPIKEEQNA